MTTMEEMEARYNKIGRSLKDLVSNCSVKDAKGKQIKLYKDKDNNLFPPFGDLAISQMKQLEIRDDDVAILGYPKTGCHWTFELISMILQGQPKNEGVGKIVGFLEMAAPEVVSAQPSPRVLNTHVHFDQLPEQMYSKKTKIVLTMRNPKDVVVSYFNHHSKLFNMYGYDGEFSDYFDMYMEGKADYGSYFDYIKKWDNAIKNHPDHPILVLSYEDMKEDLPREVRKMAKFLEKETSEDLVQAIAKEGDIGSMTNSGRFSSHILRKGQVGDWKNWLTVAQSERIDAVVADKLAGVTSYTPRYTID